MEVGPDPDAMEPGFHGVRTQWNRGFIAFRPLRRPADRGADGVGATWVRLRAR